MPKDRTMGIAAFLKKEKREKCSNQPDAFECGHGKLPNKENAMREGMLTLPRASFLRIRCSVLLRCTLFQWLHLVFQEACLRMLWQSTKFYMSDKQHG